MIFLVARLIRARYTEHMSLIVRVENNTAHFINLPPTRTFPKGVKLIPGFNSVPKKYLEELESRQIKQETRHGEPLPPRFPGKESLARLQRITTLVTVEGRRRGPQITIHQDPLAGVEDGPPPPMDLPKDKDAAKALINVTKDKDALKRWASDRRADVAAAASNKLAGIA